MPAGTEFPKYRSAYSSLNPFLKNGFSHYYHLGESTFILRGIRSDFDCLIFFSMGLYCLPMSDKRDLRLTSVSELHLYIELEMSIQNKSWSFILLIIVVIVL